MRRTHNRQKKSRWTGRLGGFLLATLLAALAACTARPIDPTAGPNRIEPLPGETHFESLRQLTHGGTNAEAYWSYDGRFLTLQRKGPKLPFESADPQPCDQIYRFDLAKDRWSLVSTGKGRTTCSYFFHDDSRILFSSTHLASPACPPEPDRSRGYVWPIYPTYQFYSAEPDGSNTLPLEAGAPSAYNAEMTTCRDGSVVFTSDRDGDLELYRARIGKQGMLEGITRITNSIGYDGGAVFSPDCSQIAWRASRPAPGQERDDYQALLKEHLVRPGRLEIWVAKADGSSPRQLTQLGVASFAPAFEPDGKRVVFSANVSDPKGRRFDLYSVRLDGSGLEQITHSGTFDSFPMFSPDGKFLAFSSNRRAGGDAPAGAAAHSRETNVFVARWVRGPEKAADTGSASAPERFRAAVERLSAPEMEGRGVGTKGGKVAESWVEDRFHALGLKPLFGSYRQEVPVQISLKVDPARTRFELAGRALELGKDFQLASISSAGAIEGELASAGYGLVIPGKRDDYAGLDVRGKIALIRRRAPKGVAESRDERAYTDLRFKAIVAKERGATAVVFWDAGEEGDAPAEEDFPSRPPTGPEGDSGIPAIHLRRAIAQPLDGAALPAPRASGEVVLEREFATAHNVVALSSGKRCPPGGTVLIGAHLDHLGMGGRDSLELSGPALHPGADDNASGVAALLEIARDLKGEGCFAFAALAAEESGIVGSSRLAALFREKGVALKAMLNLDMVGRMEGNRVIVFGSESAREWPALLGRRCGEQALDCPGGGDGIGPSDHMAFYLKGVPVLHFFTGAHVDYHRASDTAEKINSVGGVQVAALVARVARDAALSKELAFVPPTAAPELAGQVSPFGTYGKSLGRMGDRRGSGAYLGTIPDYSALTNRYRPDGPKVRGIQLSGARPGSPAEQAGVRAGDVLMKLAGHSLQNLEDMMAVLMTLKPGQEVELEVDRAGEKVVLSATVGKRSE